MSYDKPRRDRSERSREELDAVTERSSAFDVSRRSMLATTGAGILGGLFSSTGTVGAAESDALNAKTRTTIWTDEMRANARRNIGRYDWATSQRDTAVAEADARLERLGPDLESLWSLVTAQGIPRGGGLVNQREILGGYHDSGDDRLWKMKTEVDNPHGDGKLTMPTNDFGAYRESGLDDRGMFDPDLADDSLLVNEEHPEMGEGWGVDDGWGWIDENDDLGGGAGTRWNFVAYYNHWHIWRPGGILGLVRRLTDAYLYTGDRKYSRAGTVLLDRIADVYPEMDLTEYTFTLDGFWNSHGGRQTGKVVGAFWESNLMRPIVRSYDAFFPGMEDDDELVAFLEDRTDEYPGLADKDSIEKIRKNIEDGIHREILPANKDSNMIVASGGGSALVQAARALDEPDGYTKEAIEWVFQPGDEYFDGDVWNEEPENWYTTGGNILTPLVDRADRDGYFEIEAPHYNRIPHSSVRQVADYLRGYDAFDGADLYQHPKLQQSLLQNTHLLLIDEFTPQLGDAHGPSAVEWSQTSVEEGFKLTGEPIFAQLWHYQNGYSTAGINGSIFDAEPEDLSDDVQAIIDAEGPLDLPSQNLAGYGFAALRDGENYLNQSFGTTYDTSNLFADASTEVNDSFDEAIQFQCYEPGEWWTFEFDADEAGEYDLEIESLFVGSYGIYDLFLNGEQVDTVDFYSPSFTRDTITYTVDLEAGTNELRFECVGKNDESSNYLMALYYLTVVGEDEREDWENAKELGNAKRAFWMYYGRTGINAGGSTHNHGDALNLGVAAHRLELSPDLGYPERTGNWPKHDFTKGTISHNTVTVDRSRQEQRWVATPRHFEGEDERVNLIDVDAYRAYEQCDEYRRTTATITVDDEHSYAVDFFRVAGGDDHVFSFHGQVGETTAEGVDLVPQGGGTYAGEDIRKPDYGEETDYNREVGSGFNYLTNVERDTDPGSSVAVDWDIEDYWNHRDDDADGVHLRLTSFGDFDEVALADGHPPDRSGNPDSLRYALLRRQGSGLESDFVSTIEHYEGERAVENVEKVSVEGGDGHAVRVELTNGRTDYVVCAFDETDTLTVDDTFEFKGFFGLYSVEDGEPEYAYVQDGTRLKPLDEPALVQESVSRVQGIVEDFTREMSLENELTIRVAGNGGHLERHAGFVYVDNDDSDPWRGEPDPTNPIEGRDQRGQGNGTYPIEEVGDSNGNLVTFDTGRQTFTRDFVDPDQLEDGGYNYIIDDNDDVQIPLTSTWSAE
ncbi:heparinase II/III domain-containing protein [Natronosalvus caseinilyticus]|uniref:heparinase II/III domain-containing protein n=1 Tax=Natronosalvus caseinilyticus TaxID=2953747 RepID=UPI0028AA2982|nr:heparinase II/III family protein [Natronosalvus caseinilyticus]